MQLAVDTMNIVYPHLAIMGICMLRTRPQDFPARINYGFQYTSFVLIMTATTAPEYPKKVLNDFQTTTSPMC